MLDPTGVGRLSSREHWERVHLHGRAAPDARPGRFGPSRRLVHAFLRREQIAAHILWREILPKYLRMPPGSSVVEVGSAPGANLVRFARQFGLEPFGIEYTEAGVAANRALFRREGIPETHVIHGDLFDDALLERYRERFDVVFSAGLIEHFDDPRGVVMRHIRLLAPGGTLVISIPRLLGFNGLLGRLSNPEILAIHNLAIMERWRWRAVFHEIGARRIYDGYYGVLDLGLIDGHDSRLGPRFLKTIRVANAALSAILKTLPRFLRPETEWLSPYAIYIGEKEKG